MFIKKTQSARIIAVFLVAVLAIGAMSVTGQDAGHWADRYVNALHSYHALPACARYTNPDDDITLDAFMLRMASLFRSEAAQAHVTPDSISPFSSPITRLEIATYIQEAFRLEATDTSALYRFADYHLIPEDARTATSALVSAGIMGGHDSGLLDPLGRVTHAQASALLMRTAGTVFSRPGEFSGLQIATNALVNTGGVDISNTTIDGRLFITEGARDGGVRLTNVTTDFALVRGASRLELIESNVYAVDMYITTGDVEVFAYPFTNFLTAARSTGTIYLYGHYLNVIVLSEDVNVVLREGATIGNLYIIGTRGDFHVTVDGSVENLWAQGNNGRITGTGHIENIEYLHPEIIFELDNYGFELGFALFENVPLPEAASSPSRNNNDRDSSDNGSSSDDSGSDNGNENDTDNTPGDNGSGTGNNPGGGNDGPGITQPPIGEVTRDPYTNNITFTDDLGNQITISDTPPPYGYIRNLHCILSQLESGDTIKTENGIITEIIAGSNLTLNGNSFTPQHPVGITLGSDANITISNAPQDNITIIGTDNNLVDLAANPGVGADITVGGNLNINSQNLAPLTLNLTGGADVSLTLPSMGMTTLNTTYNMQPSHVTIAGRDITISTLEHVPYSLTFSIMSNRLNLQFSKNGRNVNMSTVTSLGGASVMLLDDSITFINSSVASLMGNALENVTIFAQDSDFPCSDICQEQGHSLCGIPTCMPTSLSLNIDIYPLHFCDADAIYNIEILYPVEELDFIEKETESLYCEASA